MQALQVAAKAAAIWGPWPFLNIGQEWKFDKDLCAD
jgi:hypothetical protein